MKKAVIDLGTNTFNLLIGEVVCGQFCSVYSEKMPVLLGMGGINHGVITSEAMERAKDALRHFLFICTEMNVGKVLGIGTSALRAASNREELVRFAKEELGLHLKIVSGEKEAQFIYQGVKWLHDFEENAVIMDIGGGSTEFIHVKNQAHFSEVSLNVGVSRIYQHLGKPEEYTPEHFTEIEHFLNKNEGGFFEQIQVNDLIGASGSFETLYKLALRQDFPVDKKMVELPKELLEIAIENVLFSSLEERMNNVLISPIRKRMLPIAAFKVKWTMNKLSVNNVLISPYSLKEGVFMEE